MSWNAYLHDDRGHTEGDWNYTHNCNGMANAVLYDDYESQPVFAEVFQPKLESWWRVLDGMNGPDGAALLDRIIKGIEANRERSESMAPDNGWGDTDSFVKVLTEMRDAVPEWPTIWTVHG